MDLEEILNRNYDRIVDSCCEDIVLDYLAEHETVIDKNPDFIKKLTKVATNLLQKDISLFDVPLAERLFKYYSEGIAVTMSVETEDKKEQTRLKIMQGHLFGHAADVAVFLYAKTQEFSWAERAYQFYKRSAEECECTDKIYSGLRCRDAAKIANCLYNITKESKWLIAEYEDHLTTAKKTSEWDKRFSAVCFRKAGDAAMMLSQTDSSFIPQAISCYSRFINCTKEFPIETRNHTLIMEVEKRINSLRRRYIPNRLRY